MGCIIIVWVVVSSLHVPDEITKTSHDRIVRLDGQDVADTRAFVQRVGAAGPSASVERVVMRGKERQTRRVTLGKRPVARKRQAERWRLGGRCGRCTGGR